MVNIPIVCGVMSNVYGFGFVDIWCISRELALTEYRHFKFFRKINFFSFQTFWVVFVLCRVNNTPVSVFYSLSSAESSDNKVLSIVFMWKKFCLSFSKWCEVGLVRTKWHGASSDTSFENFHSLYSCETRTKCWHTIFIVFLQQNGSRIQAKKTSVG